MKRTKKFTPVIIIVLVGLLAGFSGVFIVSRLGDKTPVNQGLTQTEKTVNGQPVLEDGTFVVDLINGTATPAELTVEVGSKVQFNSRDGRAHVIALGDAHGDSHSGSGSHNEASGRSTTLNDTAADFVSEEFGNSEGYRINFDTIGTYKFTDQNDPGINILIVVYKPSS